MFDVGWQVWFVLILVGIVVYFILDAPTNPNGIDKLAVRLWKRLFEIPELEVSEDARAQALGRLRSRYPAFPGDSVAGVLLAQAHGLANSAADGIKSLQARATAEIGLIAGAIVLLTLFTQRGDPTAPLGTAFGIALVLFFASIVANAVASWPGRYQPPSIDVYNSLETCQTSELKAPIVFELTDAVLAYYRKLQIAGIKKARWLGAGTVLLVLAILFLLFDFYHRPTRLPGVPPSHFNCPPGNPVLCNRMDQ